MFEDRGYVEGTMTRDEKIKVRVNYHWVAWLWYYFIFATLGVSALITFFFAVRAYFEQETAVMAFFIVSGILLGIYPLVVYLGLIMTEMVCTNRRVVYKTGIISIKTEEVKTEKIESIQIKQTFWGRVFGYGNICFSGTGTAKVEFYKVDNPWRIKARIEEAIDETAKEERLQEAVGNQDLTEEKKS